MSNRKIKEINKKYRDINKPTDVLSFPQIGETIYPDLNRPEILGDIVISTEKALSQAEHYGHSFSDELCFLLIHGVLHLMGYDHTESKKDEKKMKKKEDEIMMLCKRTTL